MNKHQIIQIMQRPQLLNEATLPELKVILDEYPFFQAARMLWIKNLHALEHIRFNNELKLAAIHIQDRTKMYDLLMNNVTKTGVDSPKTITIEEPEVIFNNHIDGSDIVLESKNLVASNPTEPSSYFDVDDIYDTPSGDKMDFSQPLLNRKVEIEEKHGFARVEENMVLPSADLLDYERTGSEYYSLANSSNELNIDEYRSFSEWLKVLRQQTIPEPDKKPVQNTIIPKSEKKNLIDSFLQQGTKKKIRTTDTSEKAHENLDISLKSFQESEDLMTETLANIFIQQKHFSKAMEIFERLGLKYPEKNIYFARRIKELEEQINNQ